MTLSLAHIWRHPIKGIGCEPLGSTSLQVDRPIPGDRSWAVLRDGQTDTGAWQKCATFLRGATGPGLMAIDAVTTQNGYTLRHPDCAPLSFDPETGAEALIDWLKPIWPAEKPAPVSLVKSPPEGMSDVPFPSISVLSMSSLAALSQAAGQPLDMRRFRGNFWLNGLGAFEEFDLVGRRLAIGSAILEVVEPNTRCRATEANPDTGTRDVQILDLLNTHWGHRDFGVYTRVVTPGEVSVGDAVAVL